MQGRAHRIAKGLHYPAGPISRLINRRFAKGSAGTREVRNPDERPGMIFLGLSPSLGAGPIAVTRRQAEAPEAVHEVAAASEDAAVAWYRAAVRAALHRVAWECVPFQPSFLACARLFDMGGALADGDLLERRRHQRNRESHDQQGCPCQ
jgi:hypothetical protein